VKFQVRHDTPTPLLLAQKPTRCRTPDGDHQ
jgi:hypothetical protein